MSKQNHFLKIVLLAAVLLKCTSKLNLEGLTKKNIDRINHVQIPFWFYWQMVKNVCKL